MGGGHLAARPWGLYVHVPFCPYKCDYCDFVAVGGGTRVARWHTPYAEAVTREAAHWMATLAPASPPVSIFYGGGTPTMLGAERLASLHTALVRRCGLTAGAEVTVECNPGTVDLAGLRTLRAAGVNRLSIGLQAMQDTLLLALNRRHTAAEFLAAYQAARTAGFRNISVDLMLALPGQSLANFAVGLDQVLALGPEHLSAYALQVEEGTPFFARARRGQLALPGEDADAAAFALCRARLIAAGYEHYEISNFALPGHRCRHNLLYWHDADYLGLGIGAHSHWQGWRWANTDRLAVYCAEPPAGAPEERLPPQGALAPWVAWQEAVDEARARSEGAFLGLRLLDGLDEDAYARRYGIALRAAFPGVVERLLARGLLQEAPPRRLRLASDAVAIANRVFAEFV